MGTLVVAVDGPQWPAVKWPRLSAPVWLVIATLVHCAVLWWLSLQPLPAPVRQPALEVELISPVIAPPEPIARPEPAPLLEREQLAPAEPEEIPVTPDTPKSDPIETRDMPEPSVQPVAEEVAGPTADDLLNQMARYRLDGQSQLDIAPEPQIPPMLLGLADQTNMLTTLDRPLPQLPFEPGEMGLRFYSAGFRGKLERGFDKITPEFGFVTSFGLEVKCVYVLVVVACSWDERR